MTGKKQCIKEKCRNYSENSHWRKKKIQYDKQRKCSEKVDTDTHIMPSLLFLHQGKNAQNKYLNECV